MPIKSSLNKYLTIGITAFSISAFAQDGCKKSKVTYEVTDASGNSEKGLVKLDFSGQSGNLFVVSLVGPKRYFSHDIKGAEIKELIRGRYILVIDGRNEEDNFCQQHFEFYIK
jgi:hypothetical protein